MPDFDVIDAFATLWVLALAFGGAVAGWVLMGLDYRAYLRSLRRALVAITGVTSGLPYWARRHRPDCFIELGVEPTAKRSEVLAAYRRRAKEVHPDLGGDRKSFDKVQAAFREAIEAVEAAETGGRG
ncbi:MAG: J domain-containing protein [Lacipirellulaceae bacterium]